MKLVKEIDGGLTSRTTMAFGWCRFRRTTIKLQSACQHVRPQGRDLNSRHLDYETELLHLRSTATLRRVIIKWTGFNGLNIRGLEL